MIVFEWECLVVECFWPPRYEGAGIGRVIGACGGVGHDELLRGTCIRTQVVLVHPWTSLNGLRYRATAIVVDEQC